MDVAAQDYPALFRRQVTFALDALLTMLRHEGQPSKVGMVDENAGRTMEILRYALKITPAWSVVHELLVWFSPRLERVGRWSEWLPFLLVGCEIAQRREDRTAQAELALWAGVFHRILGEYAAARHFLSMSMEIYHASGKPEQYASAVNRLAWTERLAHNLEEAQALANQALAHVAQGTPGGLMERARSFSILGAIAYDEGDMGAAEHLFQSALQLLLQVEGEAPRLAWGYADLGLALAAQGKHGEALRYYHSALDILDSIEAPVQVAVTKLNLASLYISLGEPAMTIDLCAQAYQTLRGVNDLRRVIMVETNRGIAHRMLGQYEHAKEVLQLACEHARALRERYLLINCLHELGLTCFEDAAYSAAVVAYETALAALAELGDSPQKNAFAADLIVHLEQAQAAALRRVKPIDSTAGVS